MLCPHTYNQANYLFDNAQIWTLVGWEKLAENAKGWIDLACDKYNLPILICEIGCSRLTRPDYLNVVQQQLVRSIEYGTKNRNRLLGICYFQYCDKVWAPNTTEGSFGLVANTDKTTDVVRYGAADFTHNDGFPCTNNSLNIQILESNDALKVLGNAYNGD
jgi:hypothetical protein